MERILEFIQEEPDLLEWQYQNGKLSAEDRLIVDALLAMAEE